MPADIFGEEWPDHTETRLRRADFAAAQLARLEVKGDPLTDVVEHPDDKLRREAYAEKFWREHEPRPLAERFGIFSKDRRIHFDDPPLIAKQRQHNGDQETEYHPGEDRVDARHRRAQEDFSR